MSLDPPRAEPDRPELVDLLFEMSVGAGAAVPTGSGMAIAVGAAAPVAVHTMQRLWDAIQAARRGRSLGVLKLAAEEVRRRINAGERPRSDGLFDRESPKGRRAANEAVERMIAVAADAREQRKVPYIGKLVAHFVFDNSIDLGALHLLFTIAEELSFQQFVLLSLYGQIQGGRLQDLPAVALSELGDPALSITHQNHDLMQRGLAWPRDGKRTTVYDPGELSLVEMEPIGLGALFFRAAGLASMGEDDMLETLRVARGQNSGGSAQTDSSGGS